MSHATVLRSKCVLCSFRPSLIGHILYEHCIEPMNSRLGPDWTSATCHAMHSLPIQASISSLEIVSKCVLPSITRCRGATYPTHLLIHNLHTTDTCFHDEHMHLQMICEENCLSAYLTAAVLLAFCKLWNTLFL